jgi:tRNA(Ile)-lysidine synthase
MTKIEPLPPGKYVLAVSGGVDSVALLHYLTTLLPQCLFSVAHFDHGIRPDSSEDAAFVAELANSYGLPFYLDTAELGPLASEEGSLGAKLVTAHHQDDLIETALLNIARGSDVRGLAAMSLNHNILRPLLGTGKADILRYASINNLKWREDSTNSSIRYARNRMRSKTTDMTDQQKLKLLGSIEAATKICQELDEVFDEIGITDTINLKQFRLLTHDVACLYLWQFFRHNKIIATDRATVVKCVVLIKSKLAGATINIAGGTNIVIDSQNARIARV